MELLQFFYVALALLFLTIIINGISQKPFQNSFKKQHAITSHRQLHRLACEKNVILKYRKKLNPSTTQRKNHVQHSDSAAEETTQERNW